MTQWFVSFAIASMMTAVFAFRFQTWRRPRLLLGYFALFFVVELVCEALWLPSDALGIEVGIVCLGLAGVFAGATWLVGRIGGLE